MSSLCLFLWVILGMLVKVTTLCQFLSLGLFGQFKYYNIDSLFLRVEAYGHTFSGQLRAQVKQRGFLVSALAPSPYPLRMKSFSCPTFSSSLFWFLLLWAFFEPMQSLKVTLLDSPGHQINHSTALARGLFSGSSSLFIVELRDFLYSLWISVTHLQRELFCVMYYCQVFHTEGVRELVGHNPEKEFLIPLCNFTERTHRIAIVPQKYTLLSPLFPSFPPLRKLSYQCWLTPQFLPSPACTLQLLTCYSLRKHVLNILCVAGTDQELISVE